MPLLELPKDWPASLVCHYVSGAMLFPDNNLYAPTYFARYLVGYELVPKQFPPMHTVSLPWNIVSALWQGPSINELANEVGQRSTAGITAGHVLLLIFLMTKGNAKLPSFNKAADILEQFARESKKQGKPASFYSDRSDISKAWKRMRNVAHFWV